MFQCPSESPSRTDTICYIRFAVWVWGWLARFFVLAVSLILLLGWFAIFLAVSQEVRDLLKTAEVVQYKWLFICLDQFQFSTKIPCSLLIAEAVRASLTHKKL